MRDGDVLVVWKLDRLGRSLRDLIDIMNRLTARGVGFNSLTEGIDTSTSAGRMMAGIFGTLAEFSVIWTRRDGRLPELSAAA